MEAGGIEPPSRNDATNNGLKSCELCQECCAARALHSCGSNCQKLALIDNGLQAVMTAWDQLPGPVRTAITMLVGANVPSLAGPSTLGEQIQRSREGRADPL